MVIDYFTDKDGVKKWRCTGTEGEFGQVNAYLVSLGKTQITEMSSAYVKPTGDVSGSENYALFNTPVTKQIAYSEMDRPLVDRIMVQWTGNYSEDSRTSITTITTGGSTSIS